MNTRIDLIRHIGQEFTKGKGVEVGTFKGGFSKEIMNNWSGTLYMVDVWRAIKSGYNDASNHGEYDGGVYTDAMENIKGFEDRAFMLRMKGEHACDFISDQSLDFVYIDAAHDYNSVYEDIVTWLPKVKKGGYIGGHDYRYDPNIGVYQAVNNIFLEDYKITTYPDTSFIVKK